MSERLIDAEKIAVIVGLGNPGKHYEATRHNAGFQVVDLLVRKWLIPLQERKFQASWGAGSIEGHKILVVKPLTFMNRSGEAVSAVLKYFGIPAGLMLVIHDDLDLSCGRVKVARGGGAGGHRGILSIIGSVGVREFPRIKLGIGRPLHSEPVESYVLMPPYAQEQRIFEEMISRGAEAAEEVLLSGVEAAANRFNRKDEL
jgi:PTH1 family peptidyl-tRNA hydrolase